MTIQPCLALKQDKYASKGEIELAVRKAFREVLIVALSFGFGLAVLLLVLLGFLLVSHSVGYSAHRQAHNKEKENKDFTVELESGKIKIWR